MRSICVERSPDRKRAGGHVSGDQGLKVFGRKFYLSLGCRPYIFTTSQITVSPFDDEKHSLSLSLFLADWFEGFHEFHLSLDPLDGIQKLVLWDGSPRPNYLSRHQTRHVYIEISKILTLYYNPRTYDQIFPWHHGAGDFVVRVDGDRIEVRLVTVRQYGPLADPEDMSDGRGPHFLFVESFPKNEAGPTGWGWGNYLGRRRLSGFNLGRVPGRPKDKRKGRVPYPGISENFSERFKPVFS